MQKRKAPRSLYNIRWIVRRDWPGIEDCEADEPDAWTEADLVRHLKQRNMIGMLAEWDSTVIGYMVYSLHRHHIELERLVVHPEIRRRGIGEALIDKLRSKLSPDHRTRIEVPVRESNLAAQLWLRELGFHAYFVANESSKYDEPTYWFAYDLLGRGP
jgi:ribosomal-protein-alanine N-acetyltransferase